MAKRMTFVGIAACGHAQYLAQDPATYDRPLKDPKNIAEEYRSLVDDLRHYARTGRVRLVSDAELGPLVDEMKTCKCAQEDYR